MGEKKRRMTPTKKSKKSRASLPGPRRGTHDARPMPPLCEETLGIAQAFFGDAPAISIGDKSKFDAAMERMRLAFDGGERHSLIMALRLCLSQRTVVPEWIVQAFHRATASWYSGESKTLDDAFGLKRRKNFNHAAYRKRRKLQGDVYRAVLAVKRSGQGLTDEQFEEIGQRLGLGKTLVKEYYASTRDLVDALHTVGSEAVESYWEEQSRISDDAYEAYQNSGPFEEELSAESPPSVSDEEYEWMLEQANNWQEQRERQITEDAVHVALLEKPPE